SLSSTRSSFHQAIGDMPSLAFIPTRLPAPSGAIISFGGRPISRSALPLATRTIRAAGNFSVTTGARLMVTARIGGGTLSDLLSLQCLHIGFAGCVDAGS